MAEPVNSKSGNVESLSGSVTLPNTGDLPPLSEVSPGVKCALKRMGQTVTSGFVTGDFEVSRPSPVGDLVFDTLTYTGSRVIAKAGDKITGIVSIENPQAGVVERVLDWANDVNKNGAVSAVSSMMSKLGVVCQNTKGEDVVPVLKPLNGIDLTRRSLTVSAY